MPRDFNLGRSSKLKDAINYDNSAISPSPHIRMTISSHRFQFLTYLYQRN